MTEDYSGMDMADEGVDVAASIFAAELDDQAAEPAPQPLQRELPVGEQYPVDALGSFMADAVDAAVEKIQLPASIAAGSALAHASLAAQGHIGIELPHGQVTPASLFLLSMASSGDRKSAVDRCFGKAANDFEDRLKEQNDEVRFIIEAKEQAYDAAKNAILRRPGKKSPEEVANELVALGRPPSKPRGPMILSTDPTIEAVHKNLATGQSSQAIFSDEGTQFTQGYGMSKENAVKTSAGMSGLWDAAPIRRARVIDGNTVIKGRRVCLHLMLQVEAGLNWLGDRSIRDQGFFGRVLVACPESLKGTRFIKNTSPWEAGRRDRQITCFQDKLTECFNRPLRYNDDESGELEPKVVGMSHAAAELWTEYVNQVEQLSCKNCPYHPIASLAAKAGEHVARLAGVTAFLHDPDLTELAESDIQRGIVLMKWYLGEALRIVEASAAAPEIEQAEQLLDWLHTKWEGETISLPDIYRTGPNVIRVKAKANRIVEILVGHEWLKKVKGSQHVNGVVRRNVYQIRREYLPYQSEGSG